MSDHTVSDDEISSDDGLDQFDHFDPINGSDVVALPDIAEAIEEEPENDDDETEETNTAADDQTAAPSRGGESYYSYAEGRVQAPRVRDMIIVAPEDRRSSTRMTHAEMARAVGIRATQIEKGGEFYVDIDGLDHAAQIAWKEFRERRSPLKLRRIVGRSPRNESIVEEFLVREMTYPPR